MICELTGMDVSNASLYDGASAAAEACAMTKDRKRSTIYVSETVDARILEVIRTYSFGRDTEVKVVPACECGGVTDVEALHLPPENIVVVGDSYAKDIVALLRCCHRSCLPTQADSFR